MQLKTFLATRSAAERGFQARFAAALGVSASYLSQMASGDSPISPARCNEIERLSEGAVTRQDMRDDWRAIWPDLAEPAP